MSPSPTEQMGPLIGVALRAGIEWEARELWELGYMLDGGKPRESRKRDLAAERELAMRGEAAPPEVVSASDQVGDKSEVTAALRALEEKRMSRGTA